MARAATQRCHRCNGSPCECKHSGKAHRELYRSRKWQRASTVYRQQNPFCVVCHAPALGKDKLGRPLGATDHIVPHNGDLRTFWDESNWQTLCWKCHSRKTRAER